MDLRPRPTAAEVSLPSQHVCGCPRMVLQGAVLLLGAMIARGERIETTGNVGDSLYNTQRNDMYHNALKCRSEDSHRNADG